MKEYDTFVCESSAMQKNSLDRLVVLHHLATPSWQHQVNAEPRVSDMNREIVVGNGYRFDESSFLQNNLFPQFFFTTWRKFR